MTTELELSVKLHALRQKMASLNLDAMLLTFLPDVRWLTRFSGSNGTVLLSRENAWLFTDFRYQEQVKIEVENAEPVITSDGYVAEMKSGKFPLGTRVGFQADKLAYATVEKLRTELPDVEFVPVSQFCEEFVAVKDSDELDKMRRAVAITDKVFEKILDVISPKVTEREVAAEISYWNKRFGAEKDSFDPIVASGPRGAFPHARATDNRIQNNSLVVIDMGCVVEGYCSDQTRTVAVGKIDDEARKVYNLVLEAHWLGIRSAKAGMTGRELDAIPREFLTARGYGEAFGHSLGHAVGLQVHELPTIGRKGEMKIPVGAVITIEPGIYLPGKFGVRIEDMALITENGAEPLPKATKELIEL
ncbi:MAG: aminopeptidase P family protein [Chloroherpetonaceae bacterium]|nr:aminopeptidase P family protein [Chloroherpetonaceae bacterium]MDW8436663.1 aminopeptidase P family protein [Chloroherpetonaceae bacterium]